MESEEKTEPLQAFKEGVQSGIPICLGYLAVSFAFGIQATQAGLTPLEAVVMSVTNLTSAGQFASLELIANGAALAELAFVQLIINLRYMLMSAALSQRIVSSVRMRQRLQIAFGVTDEIFGVSVMRTKGVSAPFSYGIIGISLLGWGMGTLLGATAGQILPERIISALGMAIYGMFLAIIIPETKQSRAVFLVVLCAMLLSALFTYVPVFAGISSGFRIIGITFLVAGIAAAIAPIKQEENR